MLDLPTELAELVDHEAEAYTRTFSSLIDLACINNRLRLYEIAEILGIKPRTITEWRAGRKLPHNTKHIAIVTLLARGILLVDDGQLVANPKPPSTTASPSDTSSPFNPTNHIELQKIIAAKVRPPVKDWFRELNEAVPEATALIDSLNKELGPSLSVALQKAKEIAADMNISTDQIILFAKAIFSNKSTQ